MQNSVSNLVCPHTHTVGRHRSWSVRHRRVDWAAVVTLWTQPTYKPRVLWSWCTNSSGLSHLRILMICLLEAYSRQRFSVSGWNVCTVKSALTWSCLPCIQPASDQRFDFLCYAAQIGSYRSLANAKGRWLREKCHIFFSFECLAAQKQSLVSRWLTTMCMGMRCKFTAIHS